MDDKKLIEATMALNTGIADVLFDKVHYEFGTDGFTQWITLGHGDLVLWCDDEDREVSVEDVVTKVRKKTALIANKLLGNDVNKEDWDRAFSSGRAA